MRVERVAKTHIHSARPERADFAWALLGALACSALACRAAYAYVDPSVVTYTIQAVAGVAVALGAVLGVVVRRSRRFIFKVFHIDENANKAKDPQVHRMEAPGANARAKADEEARELARALAEGRPAKRLGWPTRFLRALLASAFLIFTLLVFCPLEVVAASSGSLLFGFFDITSLVVLMGVVLTLALVFAISFVRGRAFDVVLTLVVAIGICGYVQALFMNASLPDADGQHLDLAKHLDITIVSTLVWAAIICAFLVFNAKRTAPSRALVLSLSAALLVVQGVSMVGIAQEEQAELDAEVASAGGTVAMTTYGINEVGREANVVVFVLDMFDTRVLDEAMADDPSIFDDYTGFTWYRNSTGSLIPTAHAIPYLITGVMPEHGESYEDYSTRRYEESTLLDDIQSQGFEMTFYSDSLNEVALEPYGENLVPVEAHRVDGEALWPLLAKVGLYRDGPWILKPLFWFYTNQLNKTTADNYVMDDAGYLATLREEGLSFSKNASKAYRFIHLHGDHWPYVMSKEGELVSEDESSQLEQAEGSILMVGEYLQELKRLGIYDQTTVIVTSDHGEWYIAEAPLERPSTPILLVKPAETPEEAAEPLEISEAPTGHVDLPATIIDAVGGDSTAYGTTVQEVEEGPRDRYYWMTTYYPEGDYHSWDEYVINGDSQDIGNWHLTGEEIVYK